MAFFYNTAGTLDFYTAYLNAAIAANGVPTNGYLGPYAGATAYILDPTAGNGVNIFKLNTSAATQFTFSFASPFTTPGLLTDSFRIRLVVNQGAWSNTFAFPTNVVFQRNIGVPATPATAGMFEIEFSYDATLNIWMERGRRFTPDAASTPLVGSWTNITLTVGTANGAWSTPQYKIYPDGIVRWRGLLFLPASIQAANTALFTMPAGFRVPTGTGVSEAIKVGRITTATPNEGSAFLITDSTGVVKLRSASVASDILVLTGVEYDSVAA